MPGTDNSERIAIVGVGGIFPGAPDLDTFWHNISHGIDAGRQVPDGRWYLSPDKAYAPWPPQPDRVYSTWGCFIEGFQFDPAGLDLDRELLSHLDPMFHLGLHAARAAYRDARQLAGVEHSRVGVILGNIALPTESTSAICRDILGRTFVEKLIDTAAAAARQDSSTPWNTALADPAKLEALKASLKRSHWDPRNRFAAGLPSSLIAQGLGFGGIAFTLDAACASSLYSLKFAAEELLSHRADAMLAGGMSRPDCQYTQMGFSQLQALSRKGRCAPLSSEADGLVVGEGAGVFVLKRLSDAVAQGDHIYGVIAGIGLSNDRGANLLAPHSEGQLRAMRSAYEQAGWKPSDVDLIECHATGTPVGDAVEISSLHQLWEGESARPRQCVIGGVKSNVGHLLTGAGAAGLMKVLYALKHETLPPTANFSQPAERLSASDSPFRVLSRSEPWQRRAPAGSSNATAIPRRATINAFGFGGINAHVLIEEWKGAAVGPQQASGAQRPASGTPPTALSTQYSVLSTESASVPLNSSDIPIAIVGMDIHIGTWGSKQAFQENGLQCKPFEFVDLNWWGVDQTSWFQREQIIDDYGHAPARPTRPVGKAITEVRLPMSQFRIPPLEMRDMLPQQQVMLKVVAGALRDAELPHLQGTGDSKPEPISDELANRTGVIVGIELDPNTTNFHFRWSIEQDAEHWAELLGLDLSPDELAAWVKSLKHAAGPPLTPNGVMGNLGGIVASRLAREFDVGGPSFTVSCGGMSDVVARELATQALQRHELDRAIVGGVLLSTDPRWHAFVLTPDEYVHDSLEPPPEDFRCHRLDIAEALVLRRLNDATQRADRAYAVIKESPFKIEPRENSSVGLKRQFGLVGGSPVAGNTVYRVLDLYYGTEHSIRAVDALETHDWRSGEISMFIPRRRSAVAFVPSNEVRRVSKHEMILEESTIPANVFVTNEKRRPIGELPFGLFIAQGQSVHDLIQQFDQLLQLAEQPQSIEHLAKCWFHRHKTTESKPHRIVFIATTAGDLRSSVELGRRHLLNDASQPLATKQLFYSPDNNAAARFAFVFPGSGNAFPGMGRTLLSVFPDVLRRQQAENDDLPAQLAMKYYWFQWGKGKVVDHKSMIFAQVAIGAAVCDLLALFGVHPSASIGYSLGESAAFFGLRAWTDRDDMLARMERASLFGSDLVAPFDAARRAWQIPEGQEVPWLSGVIDRSAAGVRTAIDQMRGVVPELRLYLLIVNTPTQCVIGGERTQVEQLVRDLNANFVPLPSPSTVHCNVLRQVEEAYRELHLMSTTVPMIETPDGPKPIDFYSAAWGHKYSLSRESAAEAIVAQAVDTIDFPRVIEQAYADGVRTFVEIGPGSSCTKMIDEILGDRPHLARPALPNTSRPVEAFFELLAALIAAGLPVDLSYLYGQSLPGSETSPGSPPREVVTKVGGSPFQIPAPPSGWKFRPLPVETPLAIAQAPLLNLPSEVNNDSPIEPSRECVSSQRHVSNDNHVGDALLPPLQHESLNRLWDQFQLMNDQRTQAHETYLRLSAKFEHLAAEQLALLAKAGVTVAEPPAAESPVETAATRRRDAQQELQPQSSTQYSVLSTANRSLTLPEAVPVMPVEPPTSLTREQCMEFAIGQIGRVLGQKFAEIDKHPTRVRLPDEPLMLVDRILTIEGEPLSMTSGRVVTEHDIHQGAWYLDCGRIPTCIAVESGQADLFLSGWLGIDFETKGLASYRLLDAVVTFHDALPGPGQVIHYDIKVLNFFRQGSTYLFRFEFDATVDGKPLLTMREGCAGFFTEAELAGGKGIIHTALDKRPRPGVRPADWSDPVPMSVESFDDNQLLALRRGDLAACFGPAFAGLPLQRPVTLPGLPTNTNDQLKPGLERSRMWLIDRVLKLDLSAGKFGMGTILGELDIHPDDWFLTCHFCDDQVMPGTLMYECCLHTLRIYLLRMGWIGEAGSIAYEPIVGIRSRLKCRGQVLAGTKKVWYEVTLKEIGYGKDSSGSAYCLADALMYADGKPIVEITDMSVQLTGLTKEAVERLWARRPVTVKVPSPQYDRRPAIFDTDRITAFAIGRPSDAFGDRYIPFDDQRKIARLPGPPFQFLDRVVSIENCEPWVLQAGGEIVAQYDVPVDAWYFASNRQRTMPFAVLLETALQPCGWLAGYLGSALTSETDLSFRNLGGTATQYRDVTPQSGTLSTTVKMTRVSNSAGMIIQHYDFDLRCNGEPVYVGNTYFGFFSKAALSNQIGIRDAIPYRPTPAELAVAKRGPYPPDRPFSDDQFRMIKTIESLVPSGGPYGKGCVVGTMPVDPSTWFFKAHFYQDPVVPGSLGLESFWQLLKVFAVDRWQLGSDTEFSTPVCESAAQSSKHEWVYRGQVVPADSLVTVTAVIREIDDHRRTLTAEGYLSVDGRVIYQMKNFTLGCM
jgi:acyl transferase domain-containing protein/3-hydroxymyristoyl/3-hydroxydecanoyl-(acyl carrier protein) dehydratase